MKATSLCFPILLITFGNWQEASADSVKEHCDVNGKVVSQQKLPNAEECAKACASNPACHGFTFVSHWNNCSLKKTVTKSIAIRMYSGSIAVSDGKRQVKQEGYFLDHKGKDWRQVSTNDAATCRQKCLEVNECLGFTLIEGAHVCWLKNTSAPMVEKKFFCGLKASTADANDKA